MLCPDIDNMNAGIEVYDTLLGFFRNDYMDIAPEVLKDIINYDEFLNYTVVDLNRQCNGKAYYYFKISIMVAAYTGAEELISIKQSHESGGRVNMCLAIKEMLAEGVIPRYDVEKICERIL